MKLFFFYTKSSCNFIFLTKIIKKFKILNSFDPKLSQTISLWLKSNKNKSLGMSFQDK